MAGWVVVSVGFMCGVTLVGLRTPNPVGNFAVLFVAVLHVIGMFRVPSEL